MTEKRILVTGASGFLGGSFLGAANAAEIGTLIGFTSQPTDQISVEEKKNALAIGKGFVKAHNKPKGTRVTRVPENAEDVHFKSFFNGFYPILKVEHGASLGYDTNVTQHQDMGKLANKKRENVEKLMTQLGDYTVKVYLVGKSD